MRNTGLAGGRRVARALAAGALATAIGFGTTGPASAANTFSSQWADAKWSGALSGWSYEVTLAPGKDDHNGSTTEYLKTSIRATACIGGKMYVAAFAKNEQARDLKGVELDTKNPGGTMVNRSVSAPGTLSETPSADCVSPSGPTVSKSMDATVSMKAQWYDNGSPVTYSGEDCGGTGNCYYVDAKANSPKGSLKFSGKSLSVRSTTNSWVWAGHWDLDA